MNEATEATPRVIARLGADALDVIASFFFLLALLLIVWRLVWGALAPWYTRVAGGPAMDLVLEWPMWLRFVAGLPLLIVVYSPLIILLYWLFGPPGGLGRILDFRNSERLRDFFAIGRNAFQVVAAFALCKIIWLQYRKGPGSTDWPTLLRELLEQF